MNHGRLTRGFRFYFARVGRGPRGSAHLIRFFSIVAVSIFFSAAIAGQVPDEIPDEAPPPLKILSKEEKQALAAEPEVKKHTTVALELMARRIENAERLNTAEKFDEMYKELGSFNAIMDDALKFLTKQDSDRGRVLNNFKKLEIGLRAFQPKLEVIRRNLSSQYEPYVRKLIRFIHEARAKAIEPFFGNTVVPDPPKT
jgi:hypothetical protein